MQLPQKWEGNDKEREVKEKNRMGRKGRAEWRQNQRGCFYPFEKRGKKTEES